MPNTLLQTNRVIAATPNPQNNMEQLNNQANNQNQSAINPITIPIQIQPQIATDNQQPAQNQIAPINQNDQVQVAPTPQPYNNNQNNQNIQTINQPNIQNNNIGISGIKKTSIGTTIVTPINNNINSIEGQYQSAFSETMNGIISKMLEASVDGFTYDPNNDESLQLATEYAQNSTLQGLAGNGVLNSSATAERIARIVSELIPQYEEKAYSRWIDGLNNLANTAQVVMNYDSQQFEYWKDAKDREFEERQFEFEKRQKEIENAWTRVDELGYVDNEASAVLGVAAGTPSWKAKEAKEQRQFELDKMREQYQLEYNNNVAIERIRAEIDEEQARKNYERQRELAAYENELAIQRDNNQVNNERELYNYKSQIDSKYSNISNNSNNSNNSNYARYDSIIQNRYAPKDEMTGQYTVTNENSYNELMDFLDGLYASGAITGLEYTQFVAKYGKSQYNYKNDNERSSYGVSKSF